MTEVKAPEKLTTKLKDFEEFTPYALRTEKSLSAVRTNKQLLLAALAVNIASAEILDGLKKQVFYNDPNKLLTDAPKQVELIQKALNTLNEEIPPDTLDEEIAIHPRVFHGLIGIITEAGELSEALVKTIETGKVDAVNIQEEAIGDIGWYQAILVDSLNLDFYQGLTNVVNKLIVRYPDAYSDVAARNRNLAAERDQLEIGTKDYSEPQYDI